MTNQQTKTCSKCNQSFSIDSFYITNKETGHLDCFCKKCRTKEARNHQEKQKAEHPEIYYERTLWNGMNQRAVNGKYAHSYQNNKQHQSYFKQGVTIDFGREEFKEWFSSNSSTLFSIIDAGNTPSIDRIDKKKGYKFENIQLMARIDNIRKH